MSQESYEYFLLAINEANYVWIFLSLFLSLIAYMSRAYRWKYTLETLDYQTTFWDRYHSMMIGYIINLTIPRAGEISRGMLLSKKNNFQFSKVFGTIIAERAIDLFLLGMVALLSLFLSYSDFFELFDLIKLKFSNTEATESGNLGFYIKLVIVFLFVLFGVLLFYKPSLRIKFTSFILDIFKGILSIFTCKNPWAFLGHTLLIWVLYIVYFGIAFLSLEETKNFPIEGIIMGFVAGSLGISFTNGGIGAFPLLVGLVITFYLGDSNPNAQGIGNALGMIIWVSQTLFLIFLGLISLIVYRNKISK